MGVSSVSQDLPLLDQPWFPKEEYRSRLAKVQDEIAVRRLDGLVLFQPESVTWLTGFYTRGYSSFQCVLVPPIGEPLTCCRDMEAYYLDHTGVFAPYRFWSDSDDPLEVAAAEIRQLFGPGGSLGVELSAWPLTAQRYQKLFTSSTNTTVIDASPLLARMRSIKSPAEIALMRRAAEVAEVGMATAAAEARPGITERTLAATISEALVRAGSDIPGPGVLSSGERAFHLHGSYTDRQLEEGQTVQFEVLACVRHYHARFMRTLKLDRASEEDLALAKCLIQIQEDALAAVAPGVPATVPDAIYRDGVREAGLAENYTNKTFYGVGLLLPPSGGEGPEASPAADWCFEPNMTFHSYVLARDFGFSETILVTDAGCQWLTNYPRELIITGSAA
nr:aminopeptidase P family protein [Desulfuromonadales bacterium]